MFLNESSGCLLFVMQALFFYTNVFTSLLLLHCKLFRVGRERQRCMQGEGKGVGGRRPKRERWAPRRPQSLT